MIANPTTTALRAPSFLEVPPPLDGATRMDGDLQLAPEPPLSAPAKPDDVQRIADLLAAAAPETIPLAAEEVRAQLERFLVLRDPAERAVAVAALHPIDEARSELRSVAVDDAWRGRGMGRAIVSQALNRAWAKGHDLFCFTFRPSFFSRLGFRSVPQRGLPQRANRPARLDGKERLAMAAHVLPGLEPHL